MTLGERINQTQAALRRMEEQSKRLAVEISKMIAELQVDKPDEQE